MTPISDIFRTYGPEYIDKFGDAMPSEHRKVIDAIIKCKTAACGHAVYECEACREPHTVFRSCGNRHCPNCQHHKTRQWLDKQLDRQLPGHHFLITFTVPEQIREFFRKNQKAAYNALFKSASEALQKLAADEKYIGGDLAGLLAVLHTWGRIMPYNPHLHCVVPGGAISKKDGKWHPSRVDFYVHVDPLSIIYRGKFRDEMMKAGLMEQIPAEVRDMRWNVNIQAVRTSENTVAYLAPYIFRVAISNSRIVKVEDHKVSFKYKKSKSHRWRTMTLDAMEFIRRFLQHVLPTGFMKVRYYGFLHPCCSVSLKEVSARIELAFDFELKVSRPEKKPLPELVCPKCGGKLVYQYSILPFQIAWQLEGDG